MKSGPNAIVINAFRKGGSNLLWNILQSHPQVCSPILETGEIVRSHLLKTGPLSPDWIFDSTLMQSTFASPIRSMIYRKFESFKLKNFGHPDNGSKFESTPYTLEEVQKSIICFKSVDEDHYYNSLIQKIYGEVKFILLERKPESICNGWMRAGRTASSAGKKYRRVREAFDALKQKEQVLVVQFEEVIADPFGLATRLFEFCQLEPTRLTKLRFKSKATVAKDGSHQARFGSKNRKYWLSADEVEKLFDKKIDQTQAQLIASEDSYAFRKAAGL